MIRVFANGPGDRGSILGWVIPKTQKMVPEASLLNTHHYKVSIKGKVEQSRERSSPPLHLGVLAIEKGDFGLPSTKVANFTLLIDRDNFAVWILGFVTFFCLLILHIWSHSVIQNSQEQ